jgi:hypothetical protein
MMQSEFERLAGYKVSAEDYSNVIEPMYMATSISKQEFAKMLDRKRFEVKEEKQKLIKVKELKKRVENGKVGRVSAWNKGVKNYAKWLVWKLEDNKIESFALVELEDLMLNGADNWKQFSWGGCSLIYNEDIAKALCSPSELKKTRNGMRRPNPSEDWLDVQARALYQACEYIKREATR